MDLHQKSEIFYLCILLTRTMSFDDFCMKKKSESLKDVFCVSKVKITKSLLKKLFFVKMCSKAFCVDVDPPLGLLVGAIL